MGALENSNLVCGFIAWPTNQKNAIVGQKGRGLRHATYFLKFWDPLYISGTDKVRNFKFGVRIELQAYKARNAKVDQRGVVYVT